MTDRTINTENAIKRTTCPALDQILGWEYPVLDKGFLRVIDYMGDQAAIVQMARVSYGVGTKEISEDIGLIRYLLRHRHTSPFEGCEIKLHVKLPVFVARQWIRHRMASVNEYSARYSILKDEFYQPRLEDVKAQSKVNKQGADGDVDPWIKDQFLLDLVDDCESSFSSYGRAIDRKISREQARIGLPLGTYTEWYWKIDLHNLLHFLALRMDAHAQFEIRVYADLLFQILRTWMPDVALAFEDYRVNAETFSGPVMSAIRELLPAHCNDEAFRTDLECSLRRIGVSKREVADVLAALKPREEDLTDMDPKPVTNEVDLPL